MGHLQALLLFQLRQELGHFLQPKLLADSERYVPVPSAVVQRDGRFRKRRGGKQYDSEEEVVVFHLSSLHPFGQQSLEESEFTVLVSPAWSNVREHGPQFIYEAWGLRSKLHDSWADGEFFTVTLALKMVFNDLDRVNSILYPCRPHQMASSSFHLLGWIAVVATHPSHAPNIMVRKCPKHQFLKDCIRPSLVLRWSNPGSAGKGRLFFCLKSPYTSSPPPNALSAEV